MPPIDSILVLDALRATGALLATRGEFPLSCVVAGGSAGLLAGLLSPSRTTADCDVLWTGDDDAWSRLAAAAGDAARPLGLPPTWLNRDCSIYAWCLPIGWQSRCVSVGTFGPLRVERLSRIDLIASKIVSSPKRPQDVADLRDIRPTPDELDMAAAHLDRLEAEHLDRASFDDQRAVLQTLRGAG